MNPTQSKIAITALVTAGFVVPFVLQERALQTAREAQRMTSGRLAELSQAIQHLPLATNNPSGQQSSESLQLQAEVVHLRDLAIGTRGASPNRASAVSYIKQPDVALVSEDFITASKESWKLVGYATPKNAVESLLWAASRGETNAFTNSFTLEGLNRILIEHPNSGAENDIPDDLKTINEFRVNGQIGTDLEDDVRCVLIVRQSEFKLLFELKKIGDEWKCEHFGKLVAIKRPPILR